ncbi:NAD(P)-dependent dehydrogenase (short-subunit alcohol dehydrogenase family) [Pedobacter cryoconitis]|uniref:NAD(P)-dependent dehydrogenase (Short-subunit alcohol dehydrogenase family) n=1 Tax=Pedobacter cryoconitis TaxID=188932 RepID=A0A7W9DNH9_9SPHI|nr:SDR family oxidoreductase [Pedobacter cryoconitis]MBB5624265.1 NAD(P)-dependent dehydrogenase (short-subunit alcohol dehydrogenase family) [Pedobacter cryoconitis]MBB5647305.1 NAD(P)-dependent dehydrogenase (short-subunit alcohol dehydrogenase family) [Pedobacter cryoconitis]
MKTQTVIVTGASTGIGKAIAGLFLQKGYNVIINSANEDNLRATFNELDNQERVAMVIGDISKPGTGQLLVDTAVTRFGAVDVLVNNAGIFEPKPFLEVDEAHLDGFLNINLKGTYFTSQAAVKQMLKQGEGSIINIGTVLVDHAIGGFPATAPISSKGGIHALTRQLATEFGPNNIRVNAIAPGIIRSPLQAKTGVTNADSLAGLHLLNRIGETSDVAELALYLAGSNFVTGEIINLDGGHVSGHHIG